MLLRVLLFATFAMPVAAEDLRDRWICVSMNLWTDANIPKIEGLMRRAAAAGYTGVMIAESLKFFADRGHRTLIAGYYGADPARVRGRLDAAGKAKGVEGVMSTTWRAKYDDLERFMEIVRAPK